MTQQGQQLADQAQQIANLQNDMAQVMASFQQTKSDVNNCCGVYNTNGQTDGANTKEGVSLEQNVPNPFSTETLIAFELSDAATVRLDISDATGRVLETVIEERMESGTHQIRWEGSRYPSGVYYYSLYADTVLLTKKMIKK